MRLFKATIEPQGAFATPLRGDTLFGQLCWIVYYRYGRERLEELLSRYDDAPFLIVSDAFPTGFLPKPKLPSSMLGEDQEQKKINRKKIWVTPKMLESWDFADARTEEEATGVKVTDTMRMHNSLNYRNSRTDKSGRFAPYGVEENYPGKRDLYLLIDAQQISPDEIRQMIEDLGDYGYGKDATIGKGRFGVEAFEEIDTVRGNSKAYMTLSPSSPPALEAKRIYYEPFTRFGKHGAQRAYKHAFKRPLLLADTAAVLLFEASGPLQYTGRSIRGISPAHPDTVHQGYAITWPLGGMR